MLSDGRMDWSVWVIREGNSKLEVVTVAVVDDEDRDSNSLLQIWKLRFDHKT